MLDKQVDQAFFWQPSRGIFILEFWRCVRRWANTHNSQDAIVLHHVLIQLQYRRGTQTGSIVVYSMAIVSSPDVYVLLQHPVRLCSAVLLKSDIHDDFPRILPYKIAHTLPLHGYSSIPLPIVSRFFLDLPPMFICLLTSKSGI